MRKLLPIVFLLMLCEIPVHAAITVRNGSGKGVTFACGNTYSSCNANALGVTTAAGNAIVIGFEIQVNGTSPLTKLVNGVTDNGSSHATWQECTACKATVDENSTSCGGGGTECFGITQIWYAFNVPSGITQFSFTTSATVVDGDPIGYVVAGLATGADPSDPNVETESTNQACVSNSCAGITVTNQAANEITIQILYNTDATTNITGTGWVIDCDSGSCNNNGMTHRLPTSIAASHPTFTSSGATSPYCVSSWGAWDVAPVGGSCKPQLALSGAGAC